jgi:NAD(P)-dependent dehydrogenase (short-subunit alcohol dehydrogenase family)
MRFVLRKDSMNKPVCAVVGVGPGNGEAFARRFAKEGYAIALLARSAGLSTSLAAALPDARAYTCDVSDAESVARAFAAIRSEMGDVEIVIYNAGSGVWGTVEEIKPADFEMAWRINALGGLLVSQQVIGPMKKAGKGSIVFVGATASRRGVAKTAVFAPAKAAQKSLAESMARHLWPSGIHVALIIVDGAVATPGARERMSAKPDSFFIHPSAVASTAFHLTQQDRSAWSFEVEARPFGESW